MRTIAAIPAGYPEPRASAFARAASMIGLSGSASAAVKAAETRYGADDAATRLLKAAVAPGASSDPSWAGLLTAAGALEIFSAIRERSIMGRLVGMRRVPPNIAVVLQTGHATATWSRESLPKAVSRIDYGTGAPLKILKLQSTVVASRELLRLATPSAEDLFRNALLDAVTLEQDTAFITPGNAGITDTKPASITNGVTPIASTGSPDGDIAALMGAFVGDLETAYLIGNGRVGAALNGITFPNVGARGGEVQGVPLITSRNVPPDILVMIDAAGIAFFEEGAGLDRTEQSTIELNDAPVGGAAAVPISLWQNNLVALRIEVFCNWSRARAGSVAFISGISWS